MKYLIILIVMVVAWTGVSVADENSQELLAEETLNSCEEGILGILDGKAYLHPDRLSFLNNSVFLLSDYQQWIPLSSVFRDNYGYYARSKAMECPKGHTRFKKKGNVWYCFDSECQYFYGNNF